MDVNMGSTIPPKQERSYYSRKKFHAEEKYLTPEEIAAGKPGYVLMPYETIITHVEVVSREGTTRTRQVSYWVLFKLWLNGLFHKSTLMREL